MTISWQHGTTSPAPSFAIISGALPKTAIDKLATQMSFLTASDLDNPRQTGVRLSSLQDHFTELLPLQEIACWFTRRSVNLNLARSACRRQRPQATNGLALHQDLEALGAGDPRKAALGAVIWLPLHEIDDETPSLEICPNDPGRFFFHIRDGHRYSILEDEFDLPLLAISRMSAGDALVMTPHALHRTSCKPWHTRERISLDLRFLPD